MIPRFLFLFGVLSCGMTCAQGHDQEKATVEGRAQESALTLVRDDVAPKTFKIIVLNGRSGRPFKNEIPTVLFAFHSDFAPQKNNDGEIIVGIQSPDVAAYPHFYADCRFKKGTRDGRKVYYSVEEILKLGVVSENVCSKQRVRPQPGVLMSIPVENSPLYRSKIPHPRIS